MLAENIVKMATDIKDTINDEKELEKDASKDEVEEGEDLEEGEITDDEEEAEQQTESDNKNSNSDSSKKKSEDEKENDRKRSRRDSSSKSSKRLRKELDEDEEKKRLLKEKLRMLERQMRDGDDDFDEDDDDDDDDEEEDSEPTTSKRKRSRSRSKSPKKRRNRSRSRDRSSRRDRDSGGGDRRSRRDQPRKKEICQQFMLGKCPKSPERCPYSHDCDPPKIMELCKFYLLERCAKKEKCLYLHKGFPCKYFHTGHRCLDTAESCKFSHEPLTDVTRPILLKHLEGAPKEILGDFPRLTREAAQALIFQTEAKNKGWSVEEGKSLEEIQKNIGDAVIEEAKKNLPRKKSRWGDEVSENNVPTPTSNPGPAFGTNTPNPAIMQQGPPQQQMPQRLPFGPMGNTNNGQGPMRPNMGGPGGPGGPGLLGAPPPNLRPLVPNQGQGGMMRPGFNNGGPGPFQGGGPQGFNQGYNEGYNNADMEMIKWVIITTITMAETEDSKGLVGVDFIKVVVLLCIKTLLIKVRETMTILAAAVLSIKWTIVISIQPSIVEVDLIIAEIDLICKKIGTSITEISIIKTLIAVAMTATNSKAIPLP